MSDKCLGRKEMPTLNLIERTPAPPGQIFSEEEVHAMQRATINLFERWDMHDDEAATLLGGIAPRTYQRWKNGDLGRAGIHKALRLLFKEATRGYGWIKRPNDVFAGRSALDIMLGGQLTDLMRVRRYLDAQRGAW